MKQHTGEFTFVVPATHPEAGKKLKSTFNYNEVENDVEANEVMTEKKWTVVDLVSEALKRNARSNAYQTALLPYKPATVPQEDIVERMVRDYIRIGVPEDEARAQVAILRAKSAEAAEQKKAAAAQAPAETTDDTELENEPV